GKGKIVIKTVVDHRTNGDLGFGVEAFNRLRQQMGTGVANNLYAVFIASGDDGELGIAINNIGGINQFAIHFTGKGGLGEAWTYIFGDIKNRYGAGEAALAAIGKSNYGHCIFLFQW